MKKVRQNILQMMNHFIRDDELRRSSYLFAARGKASDILTEPTPNQQQPMAAEKLIDLTNNGNYNGKILQPLRIGRASIYCHNKLSFLIQAVSNQKAAGAYRSAASSVEKQMMESAEGNVQILNNMIDDRIGMFTKSSAYFSEWATSAKFKEKNQTEMQERFKQFIESNDKASASSFSRRAPSHLT